MDSRLAILIFVLTAIIIFCGGRFYGSILRCCSKLYAFAKILKSCFSQKFKKCQNFSRSIFNKRSNSKKQIHSEVSINTDASLGLSLPTEAQEENKNDIRVLPTSILIEIKPDPEEYLKNDIRCIMCQLDKKSVRFEPCNHTCACDRCTYKILKVTKCCPVCNERITNLEDAGSEQQLS